KDLDAVLDCFHDNAMITVQTAFTVHEGKENIKRMFIDFMGAYKTIIHKDFTCTVDENNGRIVASFIAELENDDGSWTRLSNTNFWRIRDDKFQEVYIYMSGDNPLT
ncbi:MAG: nuclear transport factor 2 family protein, partial [Halieaceae bacterium]